MDRLIHATAAIAPRRYSHTLLDCQCLLLAVEFFTQLCLGVEDRHLFLKIGVGLRLLCETRL